MPRIKKIDYIFLFSILALSAIGLIMVFSASPTMGMKYGDAFYYIKRHIFYLVIGLIAFYYALHLDLEKLKSWTEALFSISAFLLIMVFIPGVG
ncbi:MAG: FtsW/RodA/SpoVE family cell cycle protein, partial [Candidatus Margulisiibacteriota bacterium]